MSLVGWLLDRLFAGEVRARVQQAVAVRDDDYWHPVNDSTPTRRPWFQVRATLEQVDDICRRNPLAARLVALTTDFVIGRQVRLTGDPWALAFWEHPQNRLAQRAYRWCAELARMGELFLVLSRNPVDGMSYVREVSALQIDQVVANPHDLERELRYHQLTDEVEGLWWPSREDPAAEQIMLHYALNRPVGEVRGASDLAQIVPWLERYDMWLEDRVRINRYKGAYLWQVRVQNALPGQLEAKKAQYSRVPRSGSIIVTGSGIG